MNKMDKPRILQVGKYYYPYFGGIEKVNFLLTEGLNKKEIKCDVLCSNNINKYEENQKNGYWIYRIARWAEFAATPIIPGIIPKLYSLLKSNKYNIIHLHHPDPFATLAILICQPKARLVVQWHMDIIKQKKLYFFFKYFERLLLKRADCILVTSPNYLGSSIPLNRFKSKCKVIPLGIPDRSLQFLGISESKLYPNKKVVFSLGRFTDYKGFEFLIKAASQLPEDHVVILAGTGPLKYRYDRIVQETQPGGRFVFAGKVSEEELSNLYQRCDVFCLPSISKNEAFGLVMLEAMTYSKPIVSTNIIGSGTSWVNLDGVSGINVPPANPEALAVAIQKLTSDPSLANRLGKGGRSRYLEQFTDELMVQRTLAVYQELSNS